MSLFDTIKASVRSKPAPRQATPAHAAKGAGSQPLATTPPNAPDSSAKRKIDWRIIVVGGDSDWFGQLEREWLTLQPHWYCQHAPGVGEAGTALEAASFDALIVDGGTCDVDILLSTMEEKLGKMICLVRCDVSDRTTLAQWNRTGMTPVAFETDAAALAINLKRIARLRSWLSDPALKKLVPLIRKLPIAPKLHAQVTEQLQSPNASIQTVAVLISQDPVMSAKILQVVNSAFFGVAQQVTDTAEAVMVMGTERIRSLILLAGVFSQYGDAKCQGFAPDPIWAHSLEVAMLARAIAFAETRDAKIAETTFTAGLLHDLGKLVLAGNVPEMYETVQRMQESKNISQLEAERLVLGTTHAEVGACLLATWGLPLPILEAIACHHAPRQSTETGFSLLAAVHVANVLSQESCAGSDGQTADSIDLEFLFRSGLGDCRNRWREVCGSPARQESESLAERLRRRKESKEN